MEEMVNNKNIKLCTSYDISKFLPIITDFDLQMYSVHKEYLDMIEDGLVKKLGELGITVICRTFQYKAHNSYCISYILDR